jgi:predicted Mrr-cat superfamily restriction endonuclease
LHRDGLFERLVVVGDVEDAIEHHQLQEKKYGETRDVRTRHETGVE